MAGVSKCFTGGFRKTKKGERDNVRNIQTARKRFTGLAIYYILGTMSEEII